MIKQFDRQNLKMLRPELQSALQAVASKYGIQVTVGNATFLGTNARFRLELNVKNADGSVVDPSREDYTKYAAMYGMKPEWLDQTFSYFGKTYKVAGLNINAKKNKINVIEVRTGKSYVMPPLMVSTGFGMSDPFAKMASSPLRPYVVIGPKNPDHAEIGRRLEQYRNDCPEGYYADGEHRAAGMSEKQIYDLNYRRIAQQIADERTKK